MAEIEYSGVKYISRIFKVKQPIDISQAQDVPAPEILAEDQTQALERDTKIARMNRVPNYDTPSQKLLQQFNANVLSSNLAENYGVVIDTETLGNANMKDFFSPVQISMKTYRIQNGVSLVDIFNTAGSHVGTVQQHPPFVKDLSNGALNLVIKPNDTTSQYISNLISAVEDSVKQGRDFRKVVINGAERCLTSDEYRTLTQLLSYRDARVFKDVNFGSFTVRVLDPEAVKKYAPRIPQGAAIASYIKDIRQGYENLIQMGTSQVDALKAINQYITNTIPSQAIQNAVSITVNGKKFDNPILARFIASVKHDFGVGYIRSFSWLPMLGERSLDIQAFMRTFVPDITQLSMKDIAARLATGRLATGAKASGGLARLENMAKVYDYVFKRMRGSFHTAGADIEATAGVYNIIMPQLASRVEAINKQYSSFPKINPKLVKYDQDIFLSTAGVSRRYEGITGFIYKLDENGQYRLTGRNVSAPIYKNTYYQLMGFQRVGKQWGMYLRNIDEDTVHLVVGKNKRQLVDIFHQTMEHVDDMDASNLSNRYVDRAMRRFRKMFDVGPGAGYNLFMQNYQAFDVLRQFAKEQNIALSNADELWRRITDKSGRINSNIMERMSKIYGKWVTPEKVRDVVYMMDTLDELWPVYDVFTKQISKSGLDDTGKSLALRNFIDMVNERFGQGLKIREASKYELQVAIPNPMGHVIKYSTNTAGNYMPFGNTKMSYINITDTSKAKSGIINILNQSSTKMSQYRAFENIIKNLYDRNVLSADEVAALRDILDAARANNDLTLLHDAAGKLGEILASAGHNEQMVATMGANYVPIDKPKFPIQLYDEANTKVLSDMASKSINRAKVLTRTGLNPYNEYLSKVIETQNKAVNAKRQYITSVFGGVKDLEIDIRTPEEAIDQLQRRFNAANMDILIMSDNDGLKLVAFAREVSDEIVKMTPSELIQSNKAIIINMPTINENGIIQLNSRWYKLNQYQLKYDPSRKRYVITTNYDEIIDAIGSAAKGARRALDEGSTYNATHRITRAIYDIVQSQAGPSAISQTSLDDYYTAVQSDNINPIYLHRKSSTVMVKDSNIIANFLYQVDRDVYNQKIAESPFYEFTLEDIPFQHTKEFDDYINNLVIGRKGTQQVKLGEYIRYGSTKESEAIKYVFAIEDMRHLLPFGAYGAGVHPATIQSFNTWRLNENAIEQKYKTRKFIRTKTFEERIGDKVAYLPLITEHMDDAMLRQALTKAGVQDDVIDSIITSIYDGQILMKKSTAEMFKTTEETILDVGDNFVLVDDVHAKTVQSLNIEASRRKGRNRVIGGVRETMEITASSEQEARKLARRQGNFLILDVTAGADLGGGQYKYTVGYINRLATTTKTYQDVLPAEVSLQDGMLVINKVHNVQQGTKFGMLGSTTKGTVHLLEDTVFEQAFGPDVEAITIGKAMKKYSPDEILRGVFNYAVVKAQEGNDAEAKLNAIAEVMRDYFGMKVEVTAGGIVVDDTVQKAANPVNIHEVVTKLSQIIGEDIGNRRVELFGRAFVNEAARLTGALEFTDTGKAVPGVVKFGPRELAAFKSLAILSGENNSAAVTFLERYTRTLSRLQNPELGAVEGNYAFFDLVAGEYVNIDTNGKVIRSASQDVVQVPTKLQSYIKALRNEQSDIVISMTSPTTDITVSDVTKGRIVLGYDFFNEVVRSKDVGRLLTEEDYSDTILNIQNFLQRQIQQVRSQDPNLARKYETIRRRLVESGGFTLELPQEVTVTVGNKDRRVNRIFVPLERLVRYGTNAETGEELYTVQQLYRDVVGILSNSQTIMQAGINDALTNEEYEKAVRGLTSSVQSYYTTVGKLISGKEGIIPAGLSARYPHSGHFTVGIVSPEVMQAKGIEEGTVFINPKELKEMTRVGYRRYMPGESDGSYIGIVNRYPTTYSRSIGVAKIVANQEVNEGMAIITPGMLYTMLGDADGDRISIALAHYSTDAYELMGVNDVNSYRTKVLTSLRNIYEKQKPLMTSIGQSIYEDMRNTLQAFGLNPEAMNFTTQDLSTIANALAGTGSVENVANFIQKLEESGFNVPLTQQQADILNNVITGQTLSAQEIQNILSKVTVRPADQEGYEAVAGMLRTVRRNVGMYSNISYKLREAVNYLHDLNDQYITVSDVKTIDTFMQAFEQSTINTKSNKVSIKAGMTLMEARQEVSKAAEGVSEFSRVVMEGTAEDIIQFTQQYGGLKSALKEDIDEDFIRQFVEARNKVGAAVGKKNLYWYLMSPEMRLGVSEQLTVGQLEELLNTSPDIITPYMREFIEAAEGQNAVHVYEDQMRQKLQALAQAQSTNSRYTAWWNNININNPFGSSSQGAGGASGTVGAATTAAVKKSAQGLTGSAKPFLIGAAAFVGLWAATALFRKSPYEKAMEDDTNPDEVQETQQAAEEEIPRMTVEPKIPGPTARIVPAGGGYERLMINIKGSNLSNMSNEELAALVAKQIQNESPVRVDINARSSDDTTKVNKQWVNDVVARATRYGLAFF